MRHLLGLDDTDSRLGHCTTHLGYLVVRELRRIGCTFPTYPRLVRLNPNVPFKTRGNAAVCVEFESDDGERAFQAAEDLLEAEADVENGANAALVMTRAESEGDRSFARRIYGRAISRLVNDRGVLHGISATEVRHVELGNGMGIVGAVASLGFPYPTEDHTYELIAYRMPENCGTTRSVDRESVKRMEIETFPRTFNSYDHESGRMLVAPTGPDPVLLGVRGDSPLTVLEAFRRIRIGEEVLGHVIYATNQCTDAHLNDRLSLPLSAFRAGWLEGEVASKEPVQGGHLVIGLRLENLSVEECMVYEPSGDLRRVANFLIPGDVVRVSGGVRRASTRHPKVINVEKIEVLSISKKTSRANPRCGDCRLSMKSEGKGKGYQCRKCGAKTSRGERPPEVATAIKRDIRLGTYLPSPRAQRHLTKQLIRYGNELFIGHDLVEGWFAETAETPERLKIVMA
ncbi:MAG: tRNA(Ile)(2)-agmatinylcytidine synthase [Thaumarchaeota archaeon]|nr:tRNA(Ile)(2)-agmatinylcytidine synthase [Nitrososphaerota archaeon]